MSCNERVWRCAAALLSAWLFGGPFARCAVGEDNGLVPAPPAFSIGVSGQSRPIPEPLSEGKSPGFAIRGTKGWLWTPEQYLSEAPVIARYKMNFLMICYGSMCDIEHYRWGDPQCNRWWEPLPEGKRKAFERLLLECKRVGVELCLSMNPNLFSARPLDYAKADDVDALWQHYRWMQALGMKWFCISLDDIQHGIDAAGQAKLTNEIFARLRANDPEARMILCPTYYWGDGTDAAAKAYLETLGAQLNPEIYLFWTGDAVVTSKITRRAAESYKAVAKHRLIIWDNYPVNDGNPTLHLGPVIGRDTDLCDVCDGYMSNPMHHENEINRLPLITCADYAYNPWAYDPMRSISQAVRELGRTEAQREVLRDLINLYPGMLIAGKGTNWNPVLAMFNELVSTEGVLRSSVVGLYKRLDGASQRLKTLFPGKYKAEQETIRRNLAEMEKIYRAKWGCGIDAPRCATTN